MRIYLVKPNKIYNYPYPQDNESSYWITDFDDSGSERNLISLEKSSGYWALLNNDLCHLDGVDSMEYSRLSTNTFYKLIINDNVHSEVGFLYIYEPNDDTFTTYQIIGDGEYRIGSTSDSNIILPSDMILPNQATLISNRGALTIRSSENAFVYVNNNRVKEKRLEIGDEIFLFGYRIIVLNGYILMSNVFHNLRLNTTGIVSAALPQQNKELLKTIDNDNATLYKENDYFSRQPRFVTSVVDETIQIVSPPAKVEQEEMPLIYTLGPMLTMTMTSAVSITTSVMSMLKSNATFKSALPALLIGVAMIASTLLWPSLMKRYNKKKLKQKEAERIEKYSKYLEEKKEKIKSIVTNQYQILKENYKEPKDLQNVIVNRNRNLWERQISSEDFLNVRIGLGTIPAKLHLNYSIEDFTMVEDELKDKLQELASTSTDIPNSPVTIDLAQRSKLVIIGEEQNKMNMLKSILLQLTAFHSYDDLKLVFMISDDSNPIWKDVRVLPHIWSDARNIRFFASNYDDMSKISFYLEQVWTSRKFGEEGGKQTEKNISYRNVKPYYLIITDNIKKNKNIEIIDKVLKEPNNNGFGLIILNNGISNLPNECSDFLTADGEKSAIITNDLNKNNQQQFVMDDVSTINLGYMFEKLAAIPIRTSAAFDELASSISFLEMYNVGKVENLNVLDRWKKNNPVNSLSVPIGVHADGELFNLDLHEKFHGPHGLIAGMTGSGKSEFIITYILSMALNFSPEEVSFVLIDYKGGGLTGAFENKITGVKLPHLAGVITNLDKAEINRSLASIHSELKRRQEMFNNVKAKLNESTLDIYKYQQLYRSGVIDEPISHLFIISDEFAELKNQQPEFMDELISTARIGRSLGVHLILATQKPSGIVDDQIWSNSKFKVCLKVQEKSDSMEVIKCPDAATIKKVGRFYLQVGYNDYFAIGQSAYSGAKYIPRDKVAKIVDRDVVFINDIGDTIKTVETTKREEVQSQGEELPNILKYICDNAKEQNLEARKLWLDKIPAEIFVDELKAKYNFTPKPWQLDAIIGEYDDPNNQKQGILTLNFNDDGNTLIYGVSGKEIMLTSMIYSLITTHTADEVNMYILDFGSEMFGTFVNAPQVGDVVFINDSEKMVNLFNGLAKELDKRKKLFADFNGNYDLYIRGSGKTLPRIIIFINNYEMLNEAYEDFVDIISSLSREGERYGIVFVITASGANAIRGKTTQNFNRLYCLEFNDPSDYMSVLGPTRGMLPSNVEGRGLTRINGELYEFQTAFPHKWDEINAFIKNVCTELNEVLTKKVSKIAILPDHVRLKDISNSISDINRVPIGVQKLSLQVIPFDLTKSPISLVCAQEISSLDKFIPSFAQVIQSINNTELFIVDSTDSISDTSVFSNYYNSSNLLELTQKLEEALTITDKKFVFIIYGVESFFDNVEEAVKKKVKSIFSEIKGNKNIRIVLADAVSKIKTLEYDEYFRSCVNTSYAIWVGSGIVDQFTIKCSTFNKETRAQIPNDFGYIVERGNATLVKLLDFYSEE